MVHSDSMNSLNTARNIHWMLKYDIDDVLNNCWEDKIRFQEESNDIKTNNLKPS